jgi:hypothetical protein
MEKLARRLVTGLALVGVAYALNPRREGSPPTLSNDQIERWRAQLGERLARLQEDYGPTLRKLAIAAGFMPGLKFRWRVLAAALPQIADRLQKTAARQPVTGGRILPTSRSARRRWR